VEEQDEDDAEGTDAVEGGNATQVRLGGPIRWSVVGRGPAGVRRPGCGLALHSCSHARIVALGPGRSVGAAGYDDAATRAAERCRHRINGRSIRNQLKMAMVKITASRASSFGQNAQPVVFCSMAR